METQSSASVGSLKRRYLAARNEYPAAKRHQLTECLGSVLDSHAPCVTRAVTIRPNSQWMNDAVVEAKRERNEGASDSGVNRV
jgi:hypothetical protein